MKTGVVALLGVIIAVLGLGGGVYAIYSTPARIPAKHLDVAPGLSGVWAGRSYAYFLRRDACVVLIDAGSDPAGTALLGELAMHQLTPDNVSTVLLTHGHIDHRAALHLLPRAKVYVGRDDASLTRGLVLPHAPFSRLLQRLAPNVPEPPQDFEMPLPGTTLSACGESIDVIALPGHTPGSLAYRIGTTLFVGDAMALYKNDIAPPAWGWSEDVGHGREMLQRLRNVAFTTLVNGHDGMATDGQTRLARWLQSAGGDGRTAITAGKG